MWCRFTGVVLQCIGTANEPEERFMSMLSHFYTFVPVALLLHFWVDLCHRQV